MGGVCSTHVRDKKFMQNFGQKTCREEHSEYPGVDVKIILEWILGKRGGKFWTGFIWFWIETSGGVLLTR